MTLKRSQELLRHDKAAEALGKFMKVNAMVLICGCIPVLSYPIPSHQPPPPPLSLTTVISSGGAQ